MAVFDSTDGHMVGNGHVGGHPLVGRRADVQACPPHAQTERLCLGRDEHREVRAGVEDEASRRRANTQGDTASSHAASLETNLGVAEDRGSLGRHVRQGFEQLTLVACVLQFAGIGSGQAKQPSGVEGGVAIPIEADVIAPLKG